MVSIQIGYIELNVFYSSKLYGLCQLGSECRENYAFPRLCHESWLGKFCSFSYFKQFFIKFYFTSILD